MGTEKQQDTLPTIERSPLETDSPNMKFPSGCFGVSKEQDDTAQPRRLGKSRPFSPAAQKCDPGLSPSAGGEGYGCRRRGAVRRSSREQSASRTRQSRADGASQPSQSEIWESMTDLRLDAAAQERWEKHARGWNDQQRELDTEQLRRPPSRKPVPAGSRSARTISSSRTASQAQMSGSSGVQGVSRAALLGLGIERAVSPLPADDDMALDTFPPSPVTPDEDAKRL
ncbi:hypothetical protein LIA77_01285 [Sarocladium implicatum]|nr:hypothetical protein LIA77_01285 [Sarocladium implicatum]